MTLQRISQMAVQGVARPRHVHRPGRSLSEEKGADTVPPGTEIARSGDRVEGVHVGAVPLTGDILRGPWPSVGEEDGLLDGVGLGVHLPAAQEAPKHKLHQTGNNPGTVGAQSIRRGIQDINAHLKTHPNGDRGIRRKTREESPAVRVRRLENGPPPRTRQRRGEIGLLLRFARPILLDIFLEEDLVPLPRLQIRNHVLVIISQIVVGGKAEEGKAGDSNIFGGGGFLRDGRENLEWHHEGVANRHESKRPEVIVHPVPGVCVRIQHAALVLKNLDKCLNIALCLCVFHVLERVDRVGQHEEFVLHKSKEVQIGREIYKHQTKRSPLFLGSVHTLIGHIVGAPGETKGNCDCGNIHLL